MVTVLIKRLRDLIIVLIWQDLIEKGEKQPNLTIGILVSIVVVILTVFFKILFGGKKLAAVCYQLILEFDSFKVIC